MNIITLERWTPLAGQFWDDISAFLYYCGDTESEKEEKIAQARAQGQGYSGTNLGRDDDGTNDQEI